MANVPNLAGVATQDLVETIGTGRFQASYINWARTMDLLHRHAPGWAPEMVPAADGGWIHQAPGVGGFLMIRFVHEDGSVRPAYPQSIMDNRNQAIPLDKITSRDITDTHRRGACMAAAMEFGLGYELWAKMPLESGYEQGPADSEEPPKQRSVTKEDFLQACLDKGLNTYAANELVSLIGVKYEAGMKTLMAKDEQWVNQKNAEAQSAALEEEGEAPPAKKRTTKRSPEEY